MVNALSLSRPTMKLTHLAGLQRNALCKVPYNNGDTFESEPRLAGPGGRVRGWHLELRFGIPVNSPFPLGVPYQTNRHHIPVSISFHGLRYR